MVCPHVVRRQYRTQETGGCILGLEQWCGTGPGGSGQGAAMQRVGGGRGGSGRGLHIYENTFHRYLIASQIDFISSQLICAIIYAKTEKLRKLI